VTEFPDYLRDEVAASVSSHTAEDSARTVVHWRERADTAEIAQLIRVVEPAEAEYRDMTAGEGDP
jgi:hypothetical protein